MVSISQEAILECISVSVNRNVLLGDKSAFAPGDEIRQALCLMLDELEIRVALSPHTYHLLKAVCDWVLSL